MKFWHIDLFQNGCNKVATPIDAMGPTFYIKKQENDLVLSMCTRSVFDVYDNHKRALFMRRYVAHFGNFFSYKSNNVLDQEKGIIGLYFNGFSFFSIIGGAGWTFYSQDNYSIDVKNWTNILRKSGGQIRDVQPLGGMWGTTLFENRRPLEKFTQLNNWARTYRPKFTQDFSEYPVRGNEAFKLFYEQTAMNPAINMRGPLARAGSSASLIYCVKSFNFSLIYNLYTKNSVRSDSLGTGLQKSLYTYNDLYKTLFANAFSAAVTNLFDDFKNYFVKPRHIIGPYGVIGAFSAFSNTTPLRVRVSMVDLFWGNAVNKHLPVDFYTRGGLYQNYFRNLGKITSLPGYSREEGLLPRLQNSRFFAQLAKLDLGVQNTSFGRSFVQKSGKWGWNKTLGVLFNHLYTWRFKNWKKYKKGRKAISIKRAFKRQLSGVNVRRFLKQASFPSFLSNAGRDVSSMLFARLLQMRRSIRRVKKSRRTIKAYRSRGIVLPARRLLSKRRRVRMRA